MRRGLALLTAGTGGLVAGIFLTGRPAPAAEADPLEKRVAELERVVLRDAFHPDASVVDRLAKVEKSLSLAGPGDLRSPDDLKKALLKLEAANDTTDRRLRTLEETHKPSDADRAVRESREKVQDAAKQTKELEQRLRKVESKP